MALYDIRLVQGDVGHDSIVTLVDPDNNNAAINVATATVKFYFRQIGASVLKATITCGKPNGGADGKVSITWPQGSLDTPGDFEGEFEITVAAKVQTAYRKVKVQVREQVQV